MSSGRSPHPFSVPVLSSALVLGLTVAGLGASLASNTETSSVAEVHEIRTVTVSETVDRDEARPCRKVRIVYAGYVPPNACPSVDNQ